MNVSLWSCAGFGVGRGGGDAEAAETAFGKLLPASGARLLPRPNTLQHRVEVLGET